MADERIDKIIDAWRQASEKFDYFLTGGTGALAAYVGQRIEPVRLGWNPTTFEVAALALLGASLYCGIKRIETMVEIYRVQALTLRAETSSQNFIRAAHTPGGEFIDSTTGRPTTRDRVHAVGVEQGEVAKVGHQTADSKGKLAVRWYQARNATLFLGLAVLVAARILPAYSK
ncbi:hypothetical protein [Roseisolibacter agri]|uniref:Uncharacterized protein n=1 Tax=Roseisolibacter agri TaxID=2014610 RepID=A0AA37QEW3_9BACT|nr:hypothetical protein [Roseisolibacter agri]GLC25080.1 hypothetical protein rosag_15930 [Roseisolibacter agri]